MSNKKNKNRNQDPKRRAALVEFMILHCKGGGHEGSKKQRHKRDRKAWKRELE